VDDDDDVLKASRPHATAPPQSSRQPESTRRRRKEKTSTTARSSSHRCCASLRSLRLLRSSLRSQLVRGWISKPLLVGLARSSGSHARAWTAQESAFSFSDISEGSGSSSDCAYHSSLAAVIFLRFRLIPCDDHQRTRTRLPSFGRVDRRRELRTLLFLQL